MIWRVGAALLLTGAVAACGGSSSSPAAVGPPSYTLTAAPLKPGTVTSGSASTAAITLTPINAYTGTIKLECGTVSGGAPAPSCSFSPSSVKIASDASPVSATLTV